MPFFLYLLQHLLFGFKQEDAQALSHVFKVCNFVIVSFLGV
ncbi:hypothetical protein T190820D02B_40301 [Tenacibaculum sp. 190524A05c]